MFNKKEREAIDTVLFNLNELRVVLIAKSLNAGLNMREVVCLDQIREQIEFWEQLRFNNYWG